MTRGHLQLQLSRSLQKEREVVFELSSSGNVHVLKPWRKPKWGESILLMGSESMTVTQVLYKCLYYRFSDDVTKIQTTKLLILMIFYFRDVYYYSQTFSLQMVSLFCDRLPLNLRGVATYTQIRNCVPENNNNNKKKTNK